MNRLERTEEIKRILKASQRDLVDECRSRNLGPSALSEQSVLTLRTILLLALFDAERASLREALTLISLGSANSMTAKSDLGAEARAALAAEDEHVWRKSAQGEHVEWCSMCRQRRAQINGEWVTAPMSSPAPGRPDDCTVQENTDG